MYVSSKKIIFSPFAQRSVGPKWFIRNLISDYSETQAENNDIWSNMLCQQIFTCGLPGSSDLSITLHLPNTIARQMGFSQALPAPISLNSTYRLCDTVLDNLDVISKLVRRNTKFRQHFIPREFRLSYYITQSFVE